MATFSVVSVHLTTQDNSIIVLRISNFFKSLVGFKISILTYKALVCLTVGCVISSAPICLHMCPPGNVSVLMYACLHTCERERARASEREKVQVKKENPKEK